MDVKRLIAGYVKLRDKKTQLEAKHKEEMAPIKDMMNQLEIKMLEVMEDTGTTSLKTDDGTAYQTVRTSATVADRDVFKQFILDNDAWEYADLRAGKTAIKALLEETGELPPGINWRENIGVNFKR